MRKIKLEGEEEKVEILLRILLDRSGSMRGSEKKTISSINEYLNGLKADKNATYKVTLAMFDDMGGLVLDYVLRDTALEAFEDITPQMYEPRGGTPLWDALGRLIEDTEVKDQPVLAVVITDGGENASRKFDRETTAKLRKEKEENGWTFVFLGADMDAFGEAGRIGVQNKNVANYSKGFEANVASAMVGATFSYTANRANVLRSSGISGQSVTASMYKQAPEESFFTEEERSKMVSKKAKK